MRIGTIRKPRDIDSELKALSARAKALKVHHSQELGELVTLTGAAGLDPETLAGALLSIVRSVNDPETKEAWRCEGARFFQRPPKGPRKTRASPSGEEAAPGDGG